MTAGELLAQVDELRPNQYSAEQKLRWLRRLDGQIAAELLDTHLPPAEGEAAAAWPPPDYGADSQLLAPFPYGEGLYIAWLFCQIDLHNGEIGKYNQSVLLLSAAWRELADWLNRRTMPKSAGEWKM